MLRYTNTLKLVGIDGIKTVCECEITKGVGIHLVGLADMSVKETLLRTVTALQATGYTIPGHKIVINLAPADLRKSGCGYDLPIALSMIAASGQVEMPGLEDALVLGELGLDGSVRAVPGAVQACLEARREDLRVIIPYDNAAEVAQFFNENDPIYPVKTLEEAVKAVRFPGSAIRASEILSESSESDQKKDYVPAWDLLRGHEAARRAAEIAAAGGHDMLLMGAPGSGKALLARAVAEILPPISYEEALEVAAIYSASGRGQQGMDYHSRPFRAPHVIASLAALMGGGAGETVLPGEVTLAHNGVFYMEDLPTAPKSVTEALRAPLEDRKVTISRLRARYEFPADALYIFASNPCPCGYYGEGDRCTCTPGQRQAYLSRLSVPLTDRLDMQVRLHPIKTADIPSLPEGEPAADVAARVARARDIQKNRFKDEQFKLNSRMDIKAIDKYCRLDGDCEALMEKLIEQLGLSARAYTRILRIARTIADLDGEQDILTKHLAEAASYRFLDRLNDE